MSAPQPAHILLAILSLSLYADQTTDRRVGRAGLLSRR